MTASLAALVQHAIERAGVSIVGVSIGDPSDKATWRVSHLLSASQADRDLADSVIAGFSATDPTVIDAENTIAANQIDGNLLIQAVAQLDFEERQKLTVKAGQTLLTAAQARARVKAIYKSLL